MSAQTADPATDTERLAVPLPAPTHTPGPWSMNGCELIGDSTVIATVHWHSGRERENEADGRALAAAPDLLAACSDWINWLDHMHWRDDAAEYERAMLNAMRRAIAKATRATADAGQVPGTTKKDPS